jgi:hypothetical protein
MTAVIDMPDSQNCDNSDDFTENTCRNVVTISEILYGTGAAEQDLPQSVADARTSKKSAAIREYCLQQTLQNDNNQKCDSSNKYCLRGWKKSKTYKIAYYNGRTGELYENVTPDSYSTDSLPIEEMHPVPDAEEGYTFKGWCPYDSCNFVNGNASCSGNVSMFITLGENSTGTKAYCSIWQHQ